MPTILLTERGRGQRPDQLVAIGKRRTDYHDLSTPGFMVRVTPTGARTFCCWYRFRGQARRLTIGAVGTWTLADARARATQVLRDAKAGIDAVAQKRADDAQEQHQRLVGETFEVLANRCLEREAPKLRASTLAAYRRTLKHDVFPKIGSITPGEVTRADVRALVDEIAARGAAIQANRTLATVKRIFSWAVGQDLIAADPCSGLSKPSPERHREANFTNEQIRKIFGALPGSEIEHLVPLIFHTAVRSNEARGAQWGEIDFERKVWTLPAARRKARQVNARDLALPLSPGAIAVLKRIPRASKKDLAAFLFPAPTAEGYLDPPQSAVEAIREKSGVKEFGLHAIRHSVRSRMSEVGVGPDIAERVLGHALTGMQRVYDAHDYAPQMRAALNAWDKRLSAILRTKSAKKGRRRA